MPTAEDATNTIINAGKSAGVALSGPIALAMHAQWRTTFAVFAGVAIVIAVGAARDLPPSRGARRPGGLPRIRGALPRLIVVTFLAGMASTAI